MSWAHAKTLRSSYSGLLLARKSSNAHVNASTIRMCTPRASTKPGVDTSLGPVTGHDVEFCGQDDNGRLTVKGKMQLASCSVDTVYDAVTDYPRAPEIFANIAESVVARNEGEVKVNQECKWKFLVFQGTFGIALLVDENEEKKTVTFTLEKSAFMRDFEGFWELEALPDGGCHVTHVLNITPVLAPPRAFQSYTSKIFISQVDGILGDLRKALESA